MCILNELVSSGIGRGLLASLRRISIIWGNACVFVGKSWRTLVLLCLVSWFFINIQMVLLGSVDGYLCSC